MSATPEQIADLCERLRSHAASAPVISRQSIDMDAAAAVISAQVKEIARLEMESTSEAKRIPDREIFYQRARTQNRIFDKLVTFFAERVEDSGITKRDIADRLGRDPAQITRWLSSPSNITIDTISDLLLALEAELDATVHSFADRPTANYTHPWAAAGEVWEEAYAEGAGDTAGWEKETAHAVLKWLDKEGDGFDIHHPDGNTTDAIIQGLYDAKRIGNMAELRAQAERVRVFEAKLEKIAGEAPAKEPSDEPTVAWPPHWSDDLRDTVNDMVLDAFRDGYTHACWRMGQIADAALAKAGAPQ